MLLQIAQGEEGFLQVQIVNQFPVMQNRYLVRLIQRVDGHTQRDDAVTDLLDIIKMNLAHSNHFFVKVVDLVLPAKRRHAELADQAGMSF